MKQHLAIDQVARDEAVILGCGSSILQLTEEERAYVNSCSVRIAINKFAAFHHDVGIAPTHLFFLDAYDVACANWLQFASSEILHRQLSGVTFVISDTLRDRLRMCDPSDYRRLEEAGYFGSLTKNPFGWRRILKEPRNLNRILVPESGLFQFVSHHHSMVGGEWAQTLDQPLFHFRGSLTSALNYLSISYPGKTVTLVGTDFNQGTSFFEDRLKDVSFAYEDWTTDIVRKAGRHYSAIEIRGGTMFDRFVFIVDRMLKSGNRLRCTNPESLLVTRGVIPFQPIVETSCDNAWQAGIVSEENCTPVAHKEVWRQCMAVTEKLIDLEMRTLELQQKSEELESIKNSWSWLIGTTLTWPVGQLVERISTIRRHLTKKPVRRQLK
ncbi:hypothetical protein [Blastopirellula marina]|uniref:hypothetical protein n=1 Tax=Blastopirellula marina TaxID=124 RepID=UPI001039ABE7|nr:hypothetical protein [Blastopirellula marina]